MSKPAREFRDFILFECLTALIVAHAWLSTTGTSAYNQVVFYTVLLIFNLVCLILIHIYHKDEGLLVTYTDNLTQQGLIYILAGIILVWVCSAFITSAYTTSVIYVPRFAFQFTLTTLVTAILWNLALIANAEETTKLVGHNALYMYLMSKGIDEKKAKTAGIGLPIAFWACLHAYISYVGALTWPLVASAFCAGLIIFAIMWKCKSLLAAITVHGSYNTILTAEVGFGWVLTAQIIGLTFLAILNISLLLLSIRRHRKCQTQ